MLVRRLAGNVGQILDLDERDAWMRVENGIAEFLSEQELDDDEVLSRVDKIPSQPAAAPLVPSGNAPPPAYRVVEDDSTWRPAFFVYTPRSVAINHRPFPDRAAAIDAAWHHKGLPPTEQRRLEAKVLEDRQFQEAAERGEVSEQDYASWLYFGAR